MKTFAFPSTLTTQSVDEYLLQLVDGLPGLSDLLLQSDDYIFARCSSKLFAVSDRRLEPNEVEQVVMLKYGMSATATLNGGADLNWRVEARRSKNEVASFRANCTRGRVGDCADGMSLTLRYVTDVPRKLESLGLEQEILDNLFPTYGLVLIVGTTGSGKSTILSSANRYRLESRTDSPTKIICYEDPIEYTYQTLGSKVMPRVFQAQIGPGHHLNAFEQAGPNAMRRGADVIVLGEIRDVKSAEAAFDLAMTGHCVYATLHVETPAQVVDRIVSFFPDETQPSAASKLRGVLRLVVAQKQFGTTTGSSARVRSWLVFDREVKEALGKIKREEWEIALSNICVQRQSTFETTAFPYVRAGQISVDAYASVANFSPNEARTYLKARGLDV
jgi:defect-in-organelle-trafficking protein DotB